MDRAVQARESEERLVPKNMRGDLIALTFLLHGHIAASKIKMQVSSFGYLHSKIAFNLCLILIPDFQK